MIDPIHNQAYQEYTRVSRQKPQDVNQKFSMDSAMQENPSGNPSTDGVIYEPSDAAKADLNKAPSSGSGHAMHSNQKASGEEENVMQTTGEASPSASSESITGMLKRWVQNAFQGIKKFLATIWESKPSENPEHADSLEADTITDEPAKIVEATDLETAQASVSETLETQTPPVTGFDPQTIDPALDADIKKALKAKDTDSFRALLSQDGHRIPAKNTSLLTYYDSKGNLVNLDPSDQYRILHGDRNSQRL